MIYTAIHNAINMTSDFNRVSEFFNPQLQRGKNILSSASAYLVVKFVPDTMPGSAPDASLKVMQGATALVTVTKSADVELTDSYVYFFALSFFGSVNPGTYNLLIEVGGYTDKMYSEFFEYIPTADLISNSVATIIASNSDDLYGYLSTSHPACGFFKFSELNCNDLGADKTTYDYSYGRSIVLEPENYLKKRFTFHNLTMYQRNLLKFLCNTQGFSINGITYCKQPEFTEESKDNSNEKFSLSAEFTPIDNVLFVAGATSAPTRLDPINLFM